ncbi:MAG: DCC1-like thiol-disulfide oxidoreductase family protein [Prochlorococcaceae cyanobacterium]
MISAASTTPASAESGSIQLIYDGGCPFCSTFATMVELRGGLPQLRIIDGRADHVLRRRLKARGFDLSRGAVLIEGERCWHGAEAVQRLCAQLRPSSALLGLLTAVFGEETRSRTLYPLLLAARHGALALRGLPLDPDDSARPSL